LGVRRPGTPAFRGANRLDLSGKNIKPLLNNPIAVKIQFRG
jgi:hypothetical protein